MQEKPPGKRKKFEARTHCLRKAGPAALAAHILVFAEANPSSILLEEMMSRVLRPGSGTEGLAVRNPLLNDLNRLSSDRS